MRRTVGLSSAMLFALGLVACGGEKAAEAPPAEAPEAAAPAPAAPMAMPADWIHTDDAAKTVTLDITAGKDATNNNWNFNGHINGNATVTVPEGYAVTINFTNNDANMAHSIGVTAKPTGPFSATPSATPAFAGGMSSNPTSMTDATKKGATEAVKFTADKAGDYALACFVPGHATAGMWIGFKVVAGATTASLESAM
jgi:FtsP/CotA-like multicopper oxidase with cupredoxin domain